jgi:hypothetical protein
MSLRPYLQGFSIELFNALVGSGDSAAQGRLHTRVDEAFTNAATRPVAHQWVDRIISGEIRATQPEVEDETLQSVIVLCARLQNVIENEYWGFWEALGNFAHRSFGTATGNRRRIIAWLLHGRPRFSNKISSAWTTCAFIANTDVSSLLEFAREEQLRTAWKRDEAVGWLDQMKNEGRDLLWVCN